MAYEGHRNNPADPPPFFDYSDPRVQYPPAYQSDAHKPQSRESSRHRESSRSRSDVSAPDKTRYSQPHQPLSEAVTSAFDKVDNTSYVPHPDLIAQITESVLKQLKTGGLDNGTPIPPSQQQYPPPPVHQPVPQSPSTHSGSSPPMPRNVYTPPSPHKYSDYPSYGSPQSQQSAVPQGGPPSPNEPSNAHFTEKRPPSRVSLSSDSSNARPKGPERLSTGKEETTLEKIWGQLFDEQGHPTVRLGQFLRGLAIHIIDVYEPCHSIVITPAKMVKYYEDVKLPGETYPWSVVFDDELSSISRMYRDLECQHHLVQERYDEKPSIPGLTPVGFERWVTLLLQAHPEEEYQRLQKAVLDMPICNPDDKKERFPKELSRRLFPTSGDGKVRDRLVKAMVEHARVELPRPPNAEAPRHAYVEGHGQSNADPPLTHRRAESSAASERPYIPPNLERERKPYSNIPAESAIDDTNPPAPVKPIERERKPYSSQPGGGRSYEDELHSTVPSRTTRSNSTTAARARPIPIGSSVLRPTGDLPVPEIHQQPRGSSSMRRRHSPSVSAGTNDFRRSDGDIRTFQPPSYQPPSMATAESFEDDGRRYARDADPRRADYARRQADDDMKKYGESPSSRTRYDPRAEGNNKAPLRGYSINEEDFYRGGGRPQGNGYDYSQPYGGPAYR